MVKGFTPREKELIGDQLIVKGREFFGLYGLKKTNIKDLTNAVGIAQGSFYKFFSSKEELYLTILQLEEKKIHQMFKESVLNSGEITSASFSKFLKATFRLVEQNPFFRPIYVAGEYEYLLRKLPEAKLEDHLKRDSLFFAPLITEWQREGIMVPKDPEVIVSLLRALFLLTLHKKEIGEKKYDQTMDLLIDFTCNGLIIKGERKDD